MAPQHIKIQTKYYNGRPSQLVSPIRSHFFIWSLFELVWEQHNHSGLKDINKNIVHR